jgi:hypothetical protein
VHFDVADVAAFHVTDTGEGESARGDFAGHMPGIVRPILPWTDTFVGHSLIGDSSRSTLAMAD